MLSRYTVFFVACALPLLFIGQIAPSLAHELDFWLLWLVAMTLVGLPVLYTEFALSARSGDTVWMGMQKLTREADAKLIWRVFAGLSVLIALLIAAHITTHIGAGVDKYLPQISLPVPAFGLSMGLMFVALILSLLKSRLLPVGLALVVIGAFISLFDGGVGSEVTVPTMTNVSLGEWARAVSLALLSVGVGTGIYWFSGAGVSAHIASHKKPLTGYIMPVWFTQLIVGSVALLASSAFVTPTSFVVSAAGMLLVAAFLLYYAHTQLIARFGLLMGVGIGVMAAVVLSAVSVFVVFKVLVVTGLLAVLVLAMFSGFGMKISHLRKTLNFKSEGRYNIWRIAIRLVVPLAVVLALIGWVLEWIR